MSNLPETKESPFLRTAFKGDPDTGEFEGYGAVFGNVDAHGDVILPGAFSSTLVSHKAAGTSPIMLWTHIPHWLIGKWTQLKEDHVGLFVRGQLNLKTEAGRDAYAHVTAGDASALSIGYQVPKDGSRFDPATRIRYLKQVELVEISIALFPSNKLARINKLESKGDLETLLTKSGLAKEAARRVAFGGWPALSGSDNTKAADLAAEIARQTAQLKAL